MKVKSHVHHPPHIYLNDSIYFLTARTYKKEKIINTDLKKRILLRNLWNEFYKAGYKLYVWVVLDNHYHIEFKTKYGKELGRILNLIHGKTSFEINKLDNTKSRKVFQNYWDRCIRNEKDFYQHFNYAHHNPVKHGYVRTQEEVLDYPFCNYRQWMDKKGREWMRDCFERYSIVDFTIEGDK
jgi:putative transposase